jgi:hypothetical protein
MNRFFVMLICCFGLTNTNAQIHEIGAFLGGSNYIGDIGSTTYTAPNEAAVGVLYKWNKSPRHAWRMGYTQSTITANDADSKIPSRKERGYQFKNNIKEVSLGLEFNFFAFNLFDYKKKLTPYVYSGISYLKYDALHIVSGETKTDDTNRSMAIPMTVGLKSNIVPNFIIGLEVGARYSFTDNIDGSNPENRETLKFGNINNNDWYVISGITVTYTFGNKACYCKE